MQDAGQAEHITPTGGDRFAIGIDIGGSSIKAALVDTSRADLVRGPYTRETPHSSTPSVIASVVADLVRACEHPAPVGVTFPGVVSGTRVRRTVNLDPSWTSVDAVEVLRQATDGRTAVLLNDADAAGLAEQRRGAAENETGTVVVLTFGTGVGSALIVNGRLFPYPLELGQLPYEGGTWEAAISGSARQRRGETWAQWASSTNTFLHAVEEVLWPDLIIIGGGITAEWSQWLGLLSTRARCKVANRRNGAGIIGAALAAQLAHRSV